MKQEISYPVISFVMTGDLLQIPVSGTGGYIMKTVELKIGGQPAQFTTKSLTYNGKEYLYSRMSNVMNDAASCNYAFAYEGQVIVLHYDPKDLKVLDAIFGQVRDLSRRTAQMKALTDAQINQHRQQQPQAGMPQTASQAPAPEQKAPAAAEQPMKQPAPSETQTQETRSDAPLTKKELKAMEKAEKARLKAEKKAEAKSRKKGAVTTSDSDTPDGHTPEEAAIRKEKLKKSFVIFGIIIAAFVLLAIIWTFTIGTGDKSAVGPKATQSQSYDDIDQLINDLQ